MLRREKNIDGIRFCFGVVLNPPKNMPTKQRVSGIGTDNEKHISESETGWRGEQGEREKDREKRRTEKEREKVQKRGCERKREREGTGMEAVQISNLFFPSLFLLNTEKFTFFPHKSAWAVCFLNITH